MRRLTFTVRETADGRVDRFVADVSGLSRSYVQKLITEGHVTVGGMPIKANEPVVRGEILELEIPDPRPLDLTPEAIPLSVVYEDADLLIIDKPAGLVVHPALGHPGGTLVNALLARDTEYGGIAGVQRPGIVHRLDRDTSGLLMVAKDDRAQASLMAQLKARGVKKTYLGLAMGAVTATSGRVEAPIGRDPHHRTRMAVVPGGREAATGYRVRERLPGWTLLELDLITGRTHQIRVHLSAIDHPLAGDPLYGTGTSRRGPAGLERLFLHSWRIELQSPSDGHLIRATAPLPPELESVLERLRQEAAGGLGVSGGPGGSDDSTESVPPVQKRPA
ncbi:MAG: RluA family pseudouridine synthase [Candidatus Limnocylindrales bacterium]|jgi:23S rRNA pseudouridine1911/1915/1917 synthase